MPMGHHEEGSKRDISRCKKSEEFQEKLLNFEHQDLRKNKNKPNQRPIDKRRQ